MTKSNDMTGARRANPWRIAAWSVAGLLLALPLVAMQFTQEVNWDAADFIFAAVMIGGTGLLFELGFRMTSNSAYRAGVAAALAAAFLVVWANAAVGMIGDEDNPFNLLFLGVIVLALIGAFLARFRAAGMGYAMAAAGTAQIIVAAIGLPTDQRGAIFSASFGLIWLLAAALFAKAARDARSVV